MASRLFVFALGFGQSSCGESTADTEHFVYNDPDAISLLQRNAQKTPKQGFVNPFITTDLDSTAPLRSFVATQEWQWPEFENGGVWDFDVPDTPVKIVSWTGMGMFMNVQALEKNYPQCTYTELPHTEKDRSIWHGITTMEAEFVITDPNTDISDADIVLFYLPFFMRTNILPNKKRPGQLWIATCGEALERPETNMDCHHALDKEFMLQFDGFASYHGTADFLDAHVELFTSYQDPPDALMLKSPMPKWTNFGAEGDDLMTLALSDCASGERNSWITKIVDQFELRGRSSSLVSYGRCFHNREEPKKKSCIENMEKWYDGWSNRCASRSFKIVAENRVEPWYVTEKVWDALWEGAVPVYFGTPEVKQIVPPNSIIYYADFESPEALADYIMGFTEETFAAARAWRELPETQWGNYTRTRRYGHQTLLPRMCVAGAKAKAALAAETGSQAPTVAPQAENAEDDIIEMVATRHHQ